MTIIQQFTFIADHTRLAPRNNKQVFYIMQIALFDLDNTLIAGDSDYLWGEFLCEHGYINSANHRALHQKYYDDYRKGDLDIKEFLEFQLRPLAGIELSELHCRRDLFISEKIHPVLLDKAIALVEQHRSLNHHLVIITATNRFITEPIAALFGINDLIATDAEMIDGRYTGKPEGVPSYAEGKVVRFEDWLKENHFKSCETWFYSDSHNDLPLLNKVDHPIAIDPDEKLEIEANKRGWEIKSLRADHN